MKVSFAVSALYIASRLCGQVSSTAAPISPSAETVLEAGDSNADVAPLATREAGRSHKKSIAGADIDISRSTSRNTRVNNVSAEQEQNGFSSLQQEKIGIRAYMWMQLGRSLPDPGHFPTDIIFPTLSTSKPAIAMNSKGSRLVLGIPMSSPDPVTEAMIYDWIDRQWLLKQTISTPNTNDLELAMSGNGNHIAIQLFDSMSETLPLVAYRRKKSSGLFEQLGGSFEGYPPPFQDSSGYSDRPARKLEISNNGSRIIQGYPGYRNDDNSKGKVILYEYDPTISTSGGYGAVFSKNGVQNIQVSLGVSVTVSGDGNRVAYGTRSGDSSPSSITIFEKGPTNTDWVQVGEIQDDPNTLLMIDFGLRVSLSGNGTRLLAGESWHGLKGVYLFDQVDGTSDWVLKARIEPESADPDCGSLESSISKDGKRAAVSCGPHNFVTVYEEDSTTGVWSSLANKITSPTDTTSSMIMSFAMSSDGKKVATGMDAFQTSPNPYSAVVYTLGSTLCRNSPLRIRVNPVETCISAPFFFFKCNWVISDPESICDPTTTSGELVRSHCPLMCNACDEFGCKDSTAFFAWGGEERQCSTWLSTLTPSEVDGACAIKRIGKTCRGSCGLCL